jgi:hypothetical protein
MSLRAAAMMGKFFGDLDRAHLRTLVGLRGNIGDV